jgi:hypothetical protein
MEPAIAIPANFDEVTGTWLGAALASRYPGLEVRGLRRLELPGHKPNKFRVEVDYASTGTAGPLPRRLVVKGSFSGQGRGATGLDIGTEMEILGYRDIVPRLSVNTPACHFIGFDADRAEGILIMEDLEAKGARFFNALSPLTYSEARQFLEGQARFHAQYWHSPQFAESDELGPNSELGRRSARLHALYLDNLAKPEALSSHRKLPRGAALPRALLDANVMAPALARLLDFNRGVAHCLIHGDEHPGNLYVDGNGVPGFLDWCIRPEPWPIAVGYFLSTALDSLDRRNWERALLSHYLDALSRYGARVPTFDEAWLAYKCSLLYPTLVWINNSSQWQSEAINTACAARAGTAMIDHETLSILGGGR